MAEQRRYRKALAFQFGGLPCIVDLYNATVSQESLSNVCEGPAGGPAHAPAGIHNHPSCDVCGNNDETTWKKGRKEGDDYTVVDVSEVKTLRENAIGGTKDTLTVFAHPAPDVHNSMQHGKGTYQVKPHKEAFRESYSAIVDTIKRHPERAFLLMWTPLTRTNVYELTVDSNDNLLMTERVRTEDVAVVNEPVLPIDPANQAAVDAMVLPNMSKPYDPATYADTFKADLDALIASRQGQPGAVVPGAAPKPNATSGVDLNSLLQSLASAQEAS